MGYGNDFISSELPSLRAAIQKGILIRERLLQQGTAQTYIHVNDIVKELVPLIQAQWLKSNAKFCYPVTIQDYSLHKKVARLWKKVDDVARKKVGKKEKDKFMTLLDQLLDITTCNHEILPCNDPNSGCNDLKNCKIKSHIKCDCPLASKVPVMELQWLAFQRSKRGEISAMHLKCETILKCQLQNSVFFFNLNRGRGLFVHF